jgi:DNA-binding transcriptional MocR family regulator
LKGVEGVSRFAKVPEEIFLDDQLDVYSKMVMVTLFLHADSSGKAFPSINTITRLSGMAKGTVARRLSQLEKLGYLKRRKRKDKAGDYDRTLYILGRGLSTRETTLSTEDTGVVYPVDKGCLPETPGVVYQVGTNIPIEQTNKHTKEQKNPSSQSPVLGSKPKPIGEIRAGEIRAAFSEFWNLYPKRQGKKAALAEFEKIFPADLSAEKLNQRLSNLYGQLVQYVDSVQDTEAKYVKFPANWLRAIDPDEAATVEEEVWVRVEGDE